MLPHECGWPLPPKVPSFGALDARSPPSDAEQIEKDLHRAGRLELGVPDDDLESHYSALRRVLRAWCWASDGQGYSQAMSRLGAMLLVAADNDPKEAFTSFAWLMRSLHASCMHLHRFGQLMTCRRQGSMHVVSPRRNFATMELTPCSQ